MDDSNPPSPGSLVRHVGSPLSVCGCPPGWPCRAGTAAGLRGLGLDLPGHRQGPARRRAAADDGLRQPLHHCRRGDVPGAAPVLEAAQADPAAVAQPGHHGRDHAGAGQWHGGAGRARGVLGPGGHGGGLGAAVDGAVLGAARPACQPRRVAGYRHRLPGRGLAQCRQQPDRIANRAGAAADRTGRLGVRFGVGARPGPAGPVHDRGRADDLRRRAAGADRPGGGRAPDHLARHQRPAGDGLPVRVRFHRRVHRLRMAAAERAPGARRQLCVRQSGDRGAAGRAAQR
ncbi:hypothetical protein G6F65_018197 [Rhizopus arrhizus]|nr:hypothetical protein G6F31_015799 [Rhizopus arrhizus]KAG1251795.1 hypothetical protein G6F65_018197 [Rhizopus arrhizus]